MRIKKGLVIEELGESYVVYDNDSSILHEFNEVGFLIFKLMRKGKSKKEIIKELKNVYDKDKRLLEEDYDDFVKVLEKKDLMIE